MSKASCCEIIAFACGDVGRSGRRGAELYVLSISVVSLATLKTYGDSQRALGRQIELHVRSTM
jgi:hypothetical protein